MSIGEFAVRSNQWLVYPCLELVARRDRTVLCVSVAGREQRRYGKVNDRENDE